MPGGGLAYTLADVRHPLRKVPPVPRRVPGRLVLPGRLPELPGVSGAHPVQRPGEAGEMSVVAEVRGVVTTTSLCHLTGHALQGVDVRQHLQILRRRLRISPRHGQVQLPGLRCQRRWHGDVEDCLEGAPLL